MTGIHSSSDGHFDAASVATSFVRARLDGSTLPAFPGPMPPTVQAAYAVQDHAIATWLDTLGGWKVGRIAEPWLSRFAVERLVGPVFSRTIREVQPKEVADFPVSETRFAAVEAEFIVRLAHDAPAHKLQWTPEEARGLVSAVHVGIELVGSALRTINDLGPAVIITDFGGNTGLLVGPSIAGWQTLKPEQLTSEVLVDGNSAGRGTAASVPGGPFAALAFALGCCAERGFPLKAGQFVSTGATTGVHEVRAGQSAKAVFGGVGEVACRVVPVHAG